MDAKRSKAGRKVGCFCTEVRQKPVHYLDSRFCSGGLVCEADPSHGVFPETIPHRPILANLVWRSGHSDQNQTGSVAAFPGRP